MSSGAVQSVVQIAVAAGLTFGTLRLTRRFARGKDWAMRVGHVWWLAAVGWLPWLLPWPGWTMLIPTTLLGLTLGPLLACQWEHDAHLCERCFGEVPADMEAQAAKRKPWLWWFHKRRPALLALVPVLILLDPSSIWTGGGHGSARLTQQVSILLVFAAVWSSDRAARLHGHYQPFCPYCRRWRRDRDAVPEPTPDPAASRS